MRLLFILLSSTSILFAQSPEKAKKLLEQVSNKIKAQKNMSIEFQYVLDNKEEQIRQEIEGTVTFADNKYKLDFLGVIQLFDGKKLYTIVPENEEITISLPEEEEQAGLNPSKLLNFYEEGYSYQMDIKQRILGKTIQFIKLIPTEANDDIKFFLLGIDIESNSIYRLIEIGNSATRTILTILNQEENISLADGFFQFNADDYPNFYINN